MAKRNTFTTLGRGVFTCMTCARRTRNTGAQSLGSELCPQCWDLSGIENEISDGNATLAERKDEIESLFVACEAKGGTPRPNFPTLDTSKTVSEMASDNRRAHDPESFARLDELKKQNAIKLATEREMAMRTEEYHNAIRIAINSLEQALEHPVSTHVGHNLAAHAHDISVAAAKVESAEAMVEFTK